MITQMRFDLKKILPSTCDGTMRMLVESLQIIDADIPAHYNVLWLLKALDGIKHYLALKKIMSLVGEDLKEFRAELKKLKSPKQLRELLKLITPPTIVFSDIC